MKWTTKKGRWNGLEIEVLEFELENPITPEILSSLKVPTPTTNDIVFISGRGPIWLYGFILHEIMHIVKAIGTFDPKLGYIIIVSHFPSINIGTIIKPEEIEWEE